MNSVVLSGRITNDLVLRFTQNNTPYVFFRLAVKRSSEESVFINCACYRKTAENLYKYKQKGNYIELQGHVESYTEQDEHGSSRNITLIVAERIIFPPIKDFNSNEDNPMGTTQKEDLPF